MSPTTWQGFSWSSFLESQSPTVSSRQNCESVIITRPELSRLTADVVGYILSWSRCALNSRFFMETRGTEKLPSQSVPLGAASIAHGRSFMSCTSGASHVEWIVTLMQPLPPKRVGKKCGSPSSGRTWYS